MARRDARDGAPYAGVVTRLLLFDVDLTLIRTKGIGRRAMDAVFERRTGLVRATRDIRFDGRTDHAVFAEVIARHGLGGADPEAAYRAIAGDYLAELEATIPACEGEVLPGVFELLDALEGQPAAAGLATGNLREGARLKLSHFGLWDRFLAGGFGDDSPVRADVIRAGMANLAKAASTDADPARTVVIGDTPLDIEGAHLAGARCLAVATGAFSVAQLLAAGADFALPDLSPTTTALEMLLS